MTAPSHCLNQCRRFTNGILWHSIGHNVAWNPQSFDITVKIIAIILQPYSLGTGEFQYVWYIMKSHNTWANKCSSQADKLTMCLASWSYSYSLHRLGLVYVCIQQAQVNKLLLRCTFLYTLPAFQNCINITRACCYSSWTRFESMYLPQISVVPLSVGSIYQL